MQCFFPGMPWKRQLIWTMFNTIDHVRTMPPLPLHAFSNLSPWLCSFSISICSGMWNTVYYATIYRQHVHARKQVIHQTTNTVQHCQLYHSLQIGSAQYTQSYRSLLTMPLNCANVDFDRHLLSRWNESIGWRRHVSKCTWYFSRQINRWTAIRSLNVSFIHFILNIHQNVRCLWICFMSILIIYKAELKMSLILDDSCKLTWRRFIEFAKTLRTLFAFGSSRAFCLFSKFDKQLPFYVPWPTHCLFKTSWSTFFEVKPLQRPFILGCT